MADVITYVGMDAHKKDLFIAMLIGAAPTPVTWQLANEPTAVRRLLRKLEREAPGPVHMFYEAGPCGYALQRQLTTPRVQCDVIAPALIPRKPGERVKTNRRGGRADEAAQRAAGPRDRDRGQGTATVVSKVPQAGGGTQADAEDRRRPRARTGGVSVGGAPAGPGRGHAVTRARHER